MMTDVALLQQPLQAGIVHVQFGGLLEEVGPQRFEHVQHRQQLQQMGWVRALHDGRIQP